MFQLQVLKKEQLYKLATQQQYVQIPLVPKRGTVYDSKGNELAVSIEVDSVYADPRKVVDVKKTTNELASILQIDRKELKQRLKSHRAFEWVQRKISSKEAEQIKAVQLPGIFFLKENRRFYPDSQLAANLIGFVGLDSKGLEGIEFQYDALLNGENRVWATARDALGREIAMGKLPFDKEDHYRNIVLTIDKPIQHITEAELDRGVEKWGAKGGMAIAMDPLTGKILAMASYPTFNPNQFIQSRSKSWRNGAVSDVFEPGSLF
jgi:cell division protein FtsI (penicillin-binding protein 3)